MRQCKMMICLMFAMLSVSTVVADEIVKTARHEHSDISGGGHIDTYIFSDNSRIIITRQPCLVCYQTGRCNICGGSGQIYSGYGAYGYWSYCNLCKGTGKCSICGGTGEFVNIIGTDGKTMRYVYANSAGASGSGTAVVHDYSTSSSSSKNRDRTYVEKVEYAPDYTGEKTRVYCDKCGCYAYPHVHIKQPVR